MPYPIIDDADDVIVLDDHESVLDETEDGTDGLCSICGTLTKGHESQEG